MKAKIQIPVGFKQVKIGRICGFDNEELYCLSAHPDFLNMQLKWERWDINGRLYRVKKGEIFIRRNLTAPPTDEEGKE